MEAAAKKQSILSGGVKVRLGILAALIFLYVLLQPWYRSYVAQLNKQNCCLARDMSRWTISEQLDKWQEEGHAYTEEELLTLAEETIRGNAQKPLEIHRVGNTLEIKGLCPSGGVITVKVTDAKLGRITTWCSEENHKEWDIGYLDEAHSTQLIY